jgi:hypothetical protein
MSSTSPHRKMAEVAPGRFVQLDFNFERAEIVLCDTVDNGDGTVRLVPRSWEKWEKVTDDLCQKLGLGRSTDTLRRLIRGGFVDGGRVSPYLYVVNLAAYFAHLKRCSEDPDYWNNPKVLAEYRTTL